MYNIRIWLISLVLGALLVTDAAFGQSIKINFQPRGRPIPAGYLPDYGEVFGDRGNSYSYGWDRDITGDARDRNVRTDQRYDTLVQFYEGGVPKTWEIALPNGGYTLFIACGDPMYNDQINTIDVEGIVVTDLNGRSYTDEYNVTALLSDGRLTIKPAPGGSKCKLMFLHIDRIVIPKAYNPVPADKAVLPSTSASLSWTPGDYAASHNVYIGDGFDDVNEGSGDTFKGNRSEASFVVDGLISGTTYYWRIDEVNNLRPGSPWKGDVWSFTIPPSTAYNPYPPDGADFVHPDVTLSWTAGLGAQSHIVYLDADFNDVNNVTGGCSGRSKKIIRGEN